MTIGVPPIIRKPAVVPNSARQHGTGMQVSVKHGRVQRHHELVQSAASGHSSQAGCGQGHRPPQHHRQHQGGHPEVQLNPHSPPSIALNEDRISADTQDCQYLVNFHHMSCMPTVMNFISLLHPLCKFGCCPADVRVVAQVVTWHFKRPLAVTRGGNGSLYRRWFFALSSKKHHFLVAVNVGAKKLQR